MKRVGILTFHFADNYGAILQTFALRTAINRIPGYQAEIINYVPQWGKVRPYSLDNHGIEQVREKRRRIERFLVEKCGIEMPMISSVCGNQYDYYCVGSDQVWNPSIVGHGDVEYFFPNLDEDAVRFSYAASIGTETACLDKEIFHRHLSRFSAVSLREGGEYIKFVRQVCNIPCEQVLDPTFLLEKNTYEKCIENKESRGTEPYILFFWYPLDEEFLKCVDFVNSLSRKYHLNIMHSIVDAPPYLFQKDSGCIMYEDIEGFLWYMKHASFVVTNSFHVTAFSLLFERPLYIFISDLGRSRLDNLVRLFHLENSVVEKYMPPSEMNGQMNYENIQERLRLLRDKSLNFLRGALEIDERNPQFSE